MDRKCRSHCQTVLSFFFQEVAYFDTPEAACDNNLANLSCASAVADTGKLLVILVDGEVPSS